MHLTFKITLFFIGGICLVMIWHGFTRMDRETELFETQMLRNHYSIAQPLATVSGRAWDELGEQFVYELVASANEADDRIRIRWVWTNPESPDRIRPEAPEETGQKLLSGMAVSWVDQDQVEAGRLYTYVPVVVEDNRLGALEISESFQRHQAYLDDSTWRIAEMTLWMVLISAGIAWLTGLVFIARPVEALIAKARAIGAGDWDTPLLLEHHGELSQLAMEMNLMSQQLAAARARLEEESAARLAALKQLRHAERLTTVGTLSAGLAHELGTPLNVIEMRAEMIRTAEVEGEEAQRNGGIIADQTARISRIIGQLMDFARVGSLRREEHQVGAVVEQALELLRPLAKKRSVNLEFCTGQDQMRAKIDADQITQVVTNLVVNAMHACESNGAGVVEVKVEQRRLRDREDGRGGQENYVAITVTDDGEGIEEERLEDIFEPFFTTKEIGQGSGLGLSVSYGIVAEHGGWIDVESERGEGTIFVVWLPAGREETG